MLYAEETPTRCRQTSGHTAYSFLLFYFVHETRDKLIDLGL